MPLGFPLRTRITNGVLLTMPFCGKLCQSEVIKPLSFRRCASRSIERMAICALTPCRIWFVTVSDPANDEVKRMSMLCSAFAFATKAGKIAFSSGSFMIEKPYRVMLTPPPASDIGFGKQAFAASKASSAIVTLAVCNPLNDFRVVMRKHFLYELQ